MRDFICSFSDVSLSSKDSHENDDADETLVPLNRERHEDVASGSEGQTSDSDCLVMSSMSVRGAATPQVKFLFFFVNGALQSKYTNDLYKRCYWLQFISQASAFRSV